MCYSLTNVKDAAAMGRLFDPRGSRQMCMRACPLGSLPAEIKVLVPGTSRPVVFSWFHVHIILGFIFVFKYFRR